MKLILLRHGESLWNKENRFTGWTDVELSDVGEKEARDAGKTLKSEGIDFDICFTSYLKRAVHTLNYVLAETDNDHLPVIKSWKLNERHYGALQGLNKAETAKKYGDEQVKLWRRSFDVRPPVLDEKDERNPAFCKTYDKVEKNLLPLAESLADTVKRVLPYFETEIKPHLLAKENVLIVAHGNSLRALIMKLENLSEKEILELNLPTATPLVYEVSDDMTIKSKKFLGDEAVIAEKMNMVARQGQAK